jgi:hypothetical protein
MSHGQLIAQFDPRTDYPQHIEGRPRLEGVHTFLASRGILLPEGRPDDPAGAETAHGLANRKHEWLDELLVRTEWPHSTACAITSSSRTTRT